jgi:hypothetical protein
MFMALPHHQQTTLEHTRKPVAVPHICPIQGWFHVLGVCALLGAAVGARWLGMLAPHVVVAAAVWRWRGRKAAPAGSKAAKSS